MKLFIDTADVEQIRTAWDWGIIDGVTTNPSWVARTGRKAIDVYKEILDIVDGPVSLETIGLTAPEIVEEAHELVKLNPKNVVIKVPLLKEGLKAVKVLSAEGIKTNVTVTFSAVQALLAAKCGATYISPFIGRLDAFGHIGMDLLKQVRTIYSNYGFETQILAAAMRHPTHILESALAGADVCTAAFDIIAQLYEHPMTDMVVNQFLNDYAKIPK